MFGFLNFPCAAGVSSALPEASKVIPMKIKRLLCGVALLLCVIGAHAAAADDGKATDGKAAAATRLDPTRLTEAQIAGIESPAVLRKLIVGYDRLGDVQRQVWALQRMSRLYPNSGDIKLAIAVNLARLGDKSKTYDHLLKMQAQGFGYDLHDDERFKPVADTKVWEYVVANLQANLKTFGEGAVAFELPKGDTLFESMAWDPKRGRLLVGSAREGKVYLVDPKTGKLEDFIAAGPDNGMWAVHAMAADPARDALYVASVASVFYKGFAKEDFGKTGVFKFSLSTGKLLEKHLLKSDAGAHALSSLTVSKNGQVFAADGVRNEIYRLGKGGLELMVANPKLTSIRGLAASDDGKYLYFADYALGLFGVDLAGGKGFDVRFNPANLVLGGIDGLYFYDGTLVAIENGMSPKRVLRLSLSADGHAITKAMPLDVANPAFTLPTYGTVAGDSLYFIANSQKGDYGQYGEPKDAAKLQPVKVFRSNLRFAWNEAGVANNIVNEARKKEKAAAAAKDGDKDAKQ